MQGGGSRLAVPLDSGLWELGLGHRARGHHASVAGPGGQGSVMSMLSSLHNAESALLKRGSQESGTGLKRVVVMNSGTGPSEG